MLYLFMYLLFRLSKKQSPQFYINFMEYFDIYCIFTLRLFRWKSNVGKHPARSNYTFHEMKLSQKHVSAEKLERNSRIGKLKRHLSSRCPCKAINAGRHISSLRLQL